MGLSSALALASSAGLNAYIPLLAYGLLARYTDVVTLPEGWTWLQDPILLLIVAILLAVELVADKFPGIDSINDFIQTLIRPSAGGIVFASALADAPVSDGSVFRQADTWVALGIGFAIALVMHLTKSVSRPVVNAGTVGVGAPVVSTAENVVAASLTATAFFFPALALLLLVTVVAMIALVVLKVRALART